MKAVVHPTLPLMVLLGNPAVGGQIDLLRATRKPMSYSALMHGLGTAILFTHIVVVA